MEDQINFNLMPSLLRGALTKTVITVLNQDGVRTFIAETLKSVGFIDSALWQVVEDKAIERVQLLPLPESLKNKVSAFVKPICLEVLQWWLFHEHYLGEIFIKERLNEIYWTPQGTIDKKKAAEAIIRDEKLNIASRYEIACCNCLKNGILILWNKMPEKQRKLFYSEEDLPVQHCVVILWTYDVKGEMNRLEDFTRIRHGCTPYQYALEGAVLDDNEVATEYILQKLTSEERETSLVRSAELFCTHTFPFDHSRDVLCFLLSQMNEEQQIEVLKNDSYAVLFCLLHWPLQGFFIKMAKRVWATNGLPTDDFYDLLKLIIKKVENGFKDYDYQYLFREFWQQSPTTHKDHILQKGRHSEDFILLYLLEIKDTGNIKLILEDLTTPDREKVIFLTCERLCIYNERDSLELFFQECLTTKNITIQFREFVKQKIAYCSKERLENQKCMWSKVFQLLDDLTQKCDDMCGRQE